MRRLATLSNKISNVPAINFVLIIYEAFWLELNVKLLARDDYKRTRNTDKNLYNHASTTRVLQWTSIRLGTNAHDTQHGKCTTPCTEAGLSKRDRL